MHRDGKANRLGEDLGERISKKLSRDTLTDEGKKQWSSVPKDLERGSWFSHHHPGGRGPSSWDLDYLANNNHLISRIVAINETGHIEIFEIAVDQDANPLILKDAVDFYRDAAKSLGDTAPARREALELLFLEFPATFCVKSRVL